MVSRKSHEGECIKISINYPEAQGCHIWCWISCIWSLSKTCSQCETVGSTNRRNAILWWPHLHSLCQGVSSNQCLISLRRIVKYLTLENRLSIYNAFIASNFNYCNTFWHFCSNRSLYKLEKLHKQALRVVLNDYSSSYRDLLDKVSKPTLYVSTLKAIATEAYKCKANENPDYINVMLNPLIKPYNLRGGPRAEQLKVNTTSYGLHSFKYQIVKLWNEMPSLIKEATSLYNFKSPLSKWAGPECNCVPCVLCKVYDV